MQDLKRDKIRRPEFFNTSVQGVFTLYVGELDEPSAEHDMPFLRIIAWQEDRDARIQSDIARGTSVLKNRM